MVNEPILMGHKPRSIRILEVCPIPWLHVRLGVGNHCFTKLCQMIPEAEEWPKVLHLHKESYHGSGFEGNEISKLLKNTQKLTDILQQCDKTNVGEKFVKVFHAFHTLNSAYSKERVDIQELDNSVKVFCTAWKEAGLSLIPKVHMIQDHLVDFVKLRDARHMYQVSEQSHEALHCEFDKTWNKYKVKEQSNPNYLPNLLKSVCDFNGTHAK